MSEKLSDIPKMDLMYPDSVRPSSYVMTDEVSYLYSREPSILNYNQRPGPSEAQKKNLLSLYDVEESVYEVNPTLNLLSNQTIKVYLRLKPFPKKMKLNQQQQEAFCIADSTTLLTKIPTQDCFSNSMVRSQSSGSDTVCRRYTFTETFGPETTQNQFFDRVIKTQMQDFLGGSNATIMSYGTTNSGKTFTLQGTTSSPGIIPRGLEYVFSQINPKPLPNFKPINSSNVVSLSPIERVQELDIKNKLLAFSTTDRNQYINTYKQMQKLLEKESPVRSSEPTDAQYAVWVTFAEIYNETIYDLLSNEIQKNRPSLKLSTDNNGIAYIKGLKSIFVTSGSEAFQVLMAGQYNLKVAATALNARSSRSHCIFTIKLLKYYKENNPDSVEISTFSFCDLAGSERLKKTLNVGDRLKEAQNINTSLLVLGRCLKSIYEGQSLKQRNEHIGPFRESKLTRLFQQPLSGKEPIALIVNVNPVPNLYVETQNVLNFSAIAKKIVLQPKKPKQRKSKTRFSQVVAHTKNSVIDWDEATELGNIIEETLSDDNCSDIIIQQEDYEDLMIENEKLQKEIKELKASAMRKEMDTREEMTKLHTEMIQKLEQDYMSRLEDVQEEQQNLRDWEIEKVEKYYSEQILQLTSKKRKRSFNDDYDLDCSTTEQHVEELQLEIEHLTSKVLSLKDSVKEAKKEKEDAIGEKNKYMFELNLVKDQLKTSEVLKKSMEQNIGGDKDFSSYIDELKVQLAEKDKKNNILKDRLNEATQEYIEMESDLIKKENLIDKLKNKLVDKRERITDMEDEMDNLNNILDKQLENVFATEKKVETLTQQLTESDQRYVELKKMYDEINNKSVIDVKEPSSPNNENLIHELQEKLLESEMENHQLNEKLSQSRTEIESLKQDLNQVKTDTDQLMTLQEQLKVLKESSDKEMQPPLQTSTELNIAIKKERIESFDISSQTSFCAVMDESNQTSFIGSCAEKMLQTSLDETEYKMLNMQNELEKAQDEYSELELKYQNEVTQVTELNNKLHELTIILEEKNDLDERLQHNKELQGKLEIQLSTLKNRVEELEEENKCLHETEESYSAQLIEIREEKDINYNICQTEHVSQISELRKEVESIKQVNAEKEEFINTYLEKISELEQKLDDIKNLNDKITELNSQLEMCHIEKKNYETKVEENTKKLESFKNNVEESSKKILDKDEEISRLQKEIKKVIKSTVDENDIKRTEEQLKHVLKELNETKNNLKKTDELNKNLQTKVLNLEKTISHTNDIKKELVELKGLNENLISAIDKKELEFQQFKKNRDEMVASYELALGNMQIELNKAKGEIKSLQMSLSTRNREETEKFRVPLSDKAHNKLSRENKPPREKEENTSDEEMLSERRGRRNRKVLEPPASPNITDVQLIETSGSESKRPTRGSSKSTVTWPSTEKKKSRRKKLYNHVDDSCINIETSIEPLASPAPSTRSLRTRRK